MKKEVVMGMAGAGRGTELHMGGYDHVHGIAVRYKTIFARRREQLDEAKLKYGFERTTTRFEDLLEDPEIDVIDICTPSYLHKEMLVRALNSGKHVICEKLLTGYFGDGSEKEPVGFASKEKMFRRCIRDFGEIENAVNRSGKKLMYAENFVYAPAIQKAAEIIKAKKSRILFMKGEESLKGSSSKVAGEWEKTGGGTFVRVGAHPLSAILWLKHQESIALGKKIDAKCVMADMAQVTKNLTEYEHRHIASRPHDVEDTSTVIIEFTDGSRAAVIANDTLLGGSKNYVELYCNDVALTCNLTLNNLMSAYMLDEDGMEDVYLSEMLPAKTGWNHPAISDEIIRGYQNQIQDFMECIAEEREPMAELGLAKETTLVLYGAYLSNERGAKVNLIDEIQKWKSGESRKI